MSFLRLTVGTAGHIDHGKSTLVKALTGTDPDRLKEEQERGMTIDIGFAEYKLSDGRMVGFVDVPGHEKFVKNMVAGATGINFVVLVVAADDGVMPQTKEHIEIMELLGINKGMVAVTKIDIVEPNVLELAIEDIKEFLKGTFLENAPLVPISSITGEGLDEFKKVFESQILAIKPPAPSGVFRLPIQRVFPAKGFGTVVTGIPTSGSCRIGERMRIYPSEEEGRIRSIQVYKISVEEAFAFHRTALNLADIDYKSIKRGDVVAPSDSLTLSNIIEVKYSHLKSASFPLKRGAPVKLHIGTLEALGNAFPLESPAVSPGENAIIELRLSQPVVCAIGDRFILRLASPSRTVGGGIVLDIAQEKLTFMRSFKIKTLKERADSLCDRAMLVESIVKASQLQPISVLEVAQKLALKKDEIDPILKNKIKEGTFLQLESGIVHRDAIEEASIRVVHFLEVYFRRNPLKLFCKTSVVLGALKMDENLFSIVLDTLKENGRLVVDGERIGLQGRRIELSSESARIAAEIERIYKDAGLKAPNKQDAVANLNAQTPRIDMLYEYLSEAGVLIHLDENLYIHRDAFNEAVKKVRSFITEHKKIDAQGAKELFGLTRKYIIPLLEAMDKQGITKRVGNYRVLEEKA
jgi:selenocysteine-specific elongation factor